MPDRIVIDAWGKGPHADLIPLQDQRNAELFKEAVERPLRERTRQLAKQREAYCRELLEARLPRRLHWLIDKPGLFKRVLRIVPRWEPTLTFVPLMPPPPEDPRRQVAAMPTEMAEHLSKVALHRSEEQGIGYVFTYTDPSGLPAEVYGPVA